MKKQVTVYGFASKTESGANASIGVARLFCRWDGLHHSSHGQLAKSNLNALIFT